MSIYISIFFRLLQKYPNYLQKLFFNPSHNNLHMWTNIVTKIEICEIQHYFDLIFIQIPTLYICIDY